MQNHRRKQRQRDMAKQTLIYRVAFHNPPQADGRTEFFFSSIAAIYDLFTPKQVGCAAQHLYNLGISDGAVYNGRLATVSRESLVSKEQTNPKRNKTTAEKQCSATSPTEC